MLLQLNALSEGVSEDEEVSRRENEKCEDPH